MVKYQNSVETCRNLMVETSTLSAMSWPCGPLCTRPSAICRPANVTLPGQVVLVRKYDLMHLWPSTVINGIITVETKVIYHLKWGYVSLVISVKKGQRAITVAVSAVRLASEVVKQVTHKNMVTKKNMGLAILALKNHPSIESYGPYDLGDPWILTHHIFKQEVKATVNATYPQWKCSTSSCTSEAGQPRLVAPNGWLLNPCWTHICEPWCWYIYLQNWVILFG